MPEDPYTIADLARLSGVTPRTVRYYVAQGLLPAPEPAGPGTRYGEGHLARLRLIRRLQRDHLPLAEIRARLEPLDDDAVARVVDEDRAPVPAESALAFVQGLMAQSGLQPRVGAPGRLLEARATYEPQIPDSYPTPGPPSAAPASPSVPVVPSVAVPAPRVQTPDRSTWERHTLAPDVELHVRRPLDRHTNKRVEQLIRIARELLAEP